MKIPGIRYLLFAALMVIIFSSCSIKEITINNLNAPHKIVIASSRSDFKNSIRDKVIKQYSDNCYIEVINLEMKKYIDSLSDKKKVVLFLSAGDEELKYSYNGVDAISSASDVAEEEKVIQEITGKIDLLLSGNRPD